MISVAMNRVPVCRSNRAPRKAPSAGAQKRWVTEGDRNSPRVLLGNLGNDTTGTPQRPLYNVTANTEIFTTSSSSAESDVYKIQLKK